MKKVLIIEPIHNDGINLLKSNKNYKFDVVSNTESDFIKKKISDYDAISVRVSKLSKEIIEEAKNLKIISRHGVGYDNIDLNTVKKNNITLSITASANAHAVAEHVLFMMLYLF